MITNYDQVLEDTRIKPANTACTEAKLKSLTLYVSELEKEFVAAKLLASDWEYRYYQLLNKKTNNE